MSDKPVIVYGASGYTGRLICEYLRHYHVPFIAAGRDKDKLHDSMTSHVPGIETADYDITVVEHDVESLTDLFSGASVVCNTVGPFSELGPAVVGTSDVPAIYAALREDPALHHTSGETCFEEPLRGESLAAWSNSLPLVIETRP